MNRADAICKKAPHAYRFKAGAKENPKWSGRILNKGILDVKDAKKKFAKKCDAGKVQLSHIGHPGAGNVQFLLESWR